MLVQGHVWGGQLFHGSTVPKGVCHIAEATNPDRGPQPAPQSPAVTRGSPGCDPGPRSPVTRCMAAEPLCERVSAFPWLPGPVLEHLRGAQPTEWIRRASVYQKRGGGRGFGTKNFVYQKWPIVFSFGKFHCSPLQNQGRRGGWQRAGGGYPASCGCQPV